MQIVEAVTFTGPDAVSFRSTGMPACGHDEVRIRTEFSTISPGTEEWCLRDLFSWQKTPYPSVPGYQRTGVITEVGKGVKEWQTGERVMATIGSWKGAETVPFWGAHLSEANTPEWEIYRIPEGCDPLDASAGVTAQVGYNAGYRPTMEPGDWFVVYGDGIIGQFAAQAARSRGARVVMAGHRKERLQAAEDAGVEAGVSSATENLVHQIREITGQETVTAIIDTVQQVEAQKQYMDLLENWKGQIVYSGFAPGTCWADMALLQQKQVTVHNVSGWTREKIESTLALMAGKKLSLKNLLTHRVPASRAPEMYSMIRKRSEPFMAITLDWTKEVE